MEGCSVADSEVGGEESGVGQRVGWVPGVVCSLGVEEGEEVLCVVGEGVRVEEGVGEGSGVEKAGVNRLPLQSFFAEALEECLIHSFVAFLVSNDELQLVSSQEEYHPPLVGAQEVVADSGVREMLELAVESAWLKGEAHDPYWLRSCCHSTWES